MIRYAIALALLIVSACAQATPEQQVVDDAAEALGGASRIKSLTALTIQGTGAERRPESAPGR